MPRTVKEFKVVLYSSWPAVYVCEKPICMCDVCTQMCLWQEEAGTVLATDASGPHLVSSACTADPQSHGSPITHVGIVAL